MLDTINALKQANNDDNLFQLITLLIALFAVFVGPIIQIITSNRQNRATVNSTNRQAWIHLLRDEITLFLSIIGSLVYARGYLNAEGAVKNIQQLFFSMSKIKLLINPKEIEHEQLIHKLDEVIAIIKEYYNYKTEEEQTKIIPQINTIIGAITSLSQHIFKLEWERVKALK